LRKALAKEQEDHAITKKAHIALKKKYWDLDEKHKELELQRKPLLPPLAKVVENAIILIWMLTPLTLQTSRLWEKRLLGSMRL
jgi:hypothetical protein